MSKKNEFDRSEFATGKSAEEIERLAKAKDTQPARCPICGGLDCKSPHDDGGRWDR